MSDSSQSLGAVFAQHKADNDLECLDPGVYRLEVTSCKARATDIMPVYKVVAGPHSGKRVMAGVFSVKSDGAIGIFKQNMKGFGLGEEVWAVPGQDSLDFFASAIKGRVADIELGVRPWQGENRNEVKIGKITLVSAPALPTPGGIPVGAAAPAPTAPAPAAPAAPSPAAPPVAAAPAPPVAAAPAPPVAAVPAPAVPAAVAPPVAAAPAPPVTSPPAPVAAVPDADPNF